MGFRGIFVLYILLYPFWYKKCMSEIINIRLFLQLMRIDISSFKAFLRSFFYRFFVWFTFYLFILHLSHFRSLSLSYFLSISFCLSLSLCLTISQFSLSLNVLSLPMYLSLSPLAVILSICGCRFFADLLEIKFAHFLLFLHFYGFTAYCGNMYRVSQLNMIHFEILPI